MTILNKLSHVYLAYQFVISLLLMSDIEVHWQS